MGPKLFSLIFFAFAAGCLWTGKVPHKLGYFERERQPGWFYFGVVALIGLGLLILAKY